MLRATVAAITAFSARPTALALSLIFHFLSLALNLLSLSSICAGSRKNRAPRVKVDEGHFFRFERRGSGSRAVACLLRVSKGVRGQGERIFIEMYIARAESGGEFVWFMARGGTGACLLASVVLYFAPKVFFL